MSEELVEKLTEFIVRGELHRESGRFDNAISILSECVQAMSVHATAYPSLLAEAHICRGAALIESGDANAGIDDLNAAIRLNSSRGLAYHHRGVAWAIKHELEQAVEDFSRAIELEPTRADSFIQRAKALNAIGRSSEAATDMARAKELIDADDRS